MASQAYFEGDFWEVLATTAPGQSPDTNPELWSKVAIPRAAATYLVQAAYATLMDTEGQNEKRGFEERMATTLLRESIMGMRRFQAHPGTMNVLTR